MIDISLVSLVILYIALVSALVGGFWWLASRRQRRDWAESDQFRVACRACGHVFTDRGAGDAAICPHCGRPNNRDSCQSL